MQQYSNTFQNSLGRPVTSDNNAQIAVYTYPGNVLAVLYSDNGVTPKSNPVTTDENGLFEFYAADGRYTLVFTSDVTSDVTLTDAVLLEDPADNTSAQISFTAAGTGAVTRTAQDKMRDFVTPQDFGAVGDNVADDYVALQASVDACRVSGKALHLVSFYATSQTVNATVSTSQNLKIVGDGFGKSGIRKTAANTDAVIRLGSSSATSFTSNVDATDFTVEGAGTANTLVGVEMFDVVQSRIRVRARLCAVGVKSNGGISLDLRGSDLSNNLIGFQGTKFTSLAGGGWPNIIDLSNSNIKNNTQRGVDFDYGRLLNLYGCDIEGNGTNGDATTAGVWVGANIGQESGLLSPGVNIGDGSWLEANSGRGAVVFGSGRNTVKDSYFVANANATNDVYVSGGRYVLKDCDFDTNKAANILETGGILSKNYIINCDYNAATIDATKTIVWGATGLLNSAISATTLTATGQCSLGGSGGSESLQVKTISNMVNRIYARGSTTGAPALLGAEGEANAAMYLVVGGTGIYQFTTGGGAYEQVRIINTTGADRSLILTGGTVDSFIGSTAGGIKFGAIPKLPSYTVATLPAASGNGTGLIYVSDGTSDKRLAVSDGTNWRWPDGAIVS